VGLEDLGSAIEAMLQKKAPTALGGAKFVFLELAAIDRVEKWIANREEEAKAMAAKEELEKALATVTSLHQRLKQANEGGGGVLCRPGKRKIEQAVDRVTKAARIIHECCEES
jgi:hypothetical protein